jgi:hypothetical protein
MHIRIVGRFLFDEKMPQSTFDLGLSLFAPELRRRRISADDTLSHTRSEGGAGNIGRCLLSFFGVGT